MPLANSTLSQARRGAAAGLASLILAGGFAAATAGARPHQHRPHAAGQRACRYRNTPAVAASAEQMRSAVVCLINHQRVERRLPALRVSKLLDRSAQGWTNRMVATGDFTHGSDFAARITATGFAWSTAGENIATGFTTPNAVVRAWMASTDHCQNILNPTFSRVGTGVNRRSVGGYGGGATWTQDFALPRGRRAPSHNWGPAGGG